MSRNLASIRKIKEISPIEGADTLECAKVDGWSVVVKKDAFKVGDLGVYFEIDSWIPHDLAPFLSKGKEPKVYNNIKGERLRTIKLRGQISQGLLLPLNELNLVENTYECLEGYDFTETLGIQKYESVDEAKISSNMAMKGNFPQFITKTHQERIQNIFDKLKPTWEVTEKLDGSSMTVYFKDGEIGVCSHNIEIKEDYDNSFWRVAKNDGIIEKLIEFGRNIAVQGELVGPSIQKNRYGLKQQTFYLFDIFDIDSKRHYLPYVRHQINEKLCLKHVPVIARSTVLTDSLQELLLSAERKSVLCSESEQEGFVYKNEKNPHESFKVISNKYLLSEQ